MTLGFRALFVRLGATVILAVSSAMGVSLWASERAEQALREERVNRALVAVETGPLQMARMQSRALATELLAALMVASNAPDPLFLGVDIRSGPDAKQELASWTAPFPAKRDDCTERRSETRTFSDGLFPYHVTLTFDRCTEVSGFRRLRWTLIAASLAVSTLIMLAFWRAFDPVLRSLRSATRSLAFPTAGANRNALPFEPAERLLATAERAVRAEKEAALAQVTRNIFHDLKTPLVAFERACRAQDWNEFSVERRGLESALSRIHAMVDALRFSEAELLIRPSHTRLDLRALIDDVRPLAAEHRVDVFATEEDVPCQVDLPKLERALANLLKNAIESGAGRVELRSTSSGTTLLLEVIDDGPGVPAILSARLFESGVTGGKLGGSGLGLAYVRSVARGHGGEVTYERHQDRSVFRISLPDALSTPGLAVAEDGGARAQAVGPTRDETMLVLLSDEAAARRFAEAAEVLGEVRMTTDPACANTASAVYIDLSRFDEVSQTVPSGVPVVIAERGEDPARVLAKLKKRMDLRSKGRS